jgi:hypothetical protein
MFLRDDDGWAFDGRDDSWEAADDGGDLDQCEGRDISGACEDMYRHP